MNDFSHLTEHKEEASEDLLVKVSRLAKDMLKQQKNVADYEALLKVEKAKLNKLSQELIPQAMSQAGMTKFELDTGETVSCKEEATVSIQDMDKLTKFLEGRGDDGIIKCDMSFGKLPQNIINRLMQDMGEKYDLAPDVKTTVHSQTLKSYFNGLLGFKKGSKAKLSIGELEEGMVNVFTLFKTIIK